jgi:Sad1 / UNC-like C-terminal
MLEDSDIRCWNSNPGDQQYIILKFGRPVRMMEIKIQFQAGFSSEILRLRVSTNNNNNNSNVWKDIEDNELEPEDKLGIQSFPLVDQPQGTDLRIDFLDFRDFYGRIVIYRLQVWGLEVSQ